jgi:serine/threonine-protein kinase RsbW
VIVIPVSRLTPVFSSTLDSVFESLDDAEASILRFAADVGFREPERYYIGLAAREILTNAIQHGNRFDPDKTVGLHLSWSGEGLIIEITDQGEGFQPESVPDPRLAENLERTSGRGLTIARALTDEFSVDRNPGGGAHVRLMKRLPKP